MVFRHRAADRRQTAIRDGPDAQEGQKTQQPAQMNGRCAPKNKAMAVHEMGRCQPEEHGGANRQRSRRNSCAQPNR